MGGAAVGGNRTASAEFNIYVDPDAAQTVFRCGKQITMFGLDVTQKAYVTAEEMERIAEKVTPVTAFFKRIADSSCCTDNGLYLEEFHFLADK